MSSVEAAGELGKPATKLPRESAQGLKRKADRSTEDLAAHEAVFREISKALECACEEGKNGSMSFGSSITGLTRRIQREEALPFP